MQRCFIISIVLMTAPHFGYGQFQNVLMSGDEVPTRAGLQPLRHVDQADLNSHGNVVVLGTTVSGLNGIWLQRSSGELDLISQDGDVVPGYADGATFFYDEDDTRIKLNDRNEVLISTEVEADVDFEGVWIAQPQGDLSLVHRGQAPAFGFPDGHVYDDADQVTFTDDGVALSSRVWDSVREQSRYAVYWWQNDQLELLAMDGDTVPASPDETTLRLPEHTTANSLGRVVVGEYGSTVDEPIPAGLWLFAANVGQSVHDVLQGDAQVLPSAPNQLYASFVADDDTVYFSGSFPNGEQGYWKSDSDGVMPLIVTGDSLEDGFVTAVFDLNANQRGDVAYMARVDDGVRDSIGIWRKRDEQAELVARKGTLAPGTDSRFWSILDFGMNERGQVAFEATLFDDRSGRGIWAENLAGDLQLVLRGNEMFDVGGGDMRQVSNLFLEQFHDDGTILLRAHFADGSAGFFTSDLVAVPEPTAALLLLISAPWMVLGNRERRRSHFATPSPAGSGS